MSESADKDSKTEEATEKKIRDTIDKGKTPSSKETTILASFVAILVFAVFFAGESINELGVFLSMFLEKPEAWPLDTERDVIELYSGVIMQIAKMLGVMMVLLVVAGIGSSVLQNMPQFVGERIRPQASRISLGSGWKRLFGVQGFVEFLKSLGKLGFVVLVLIFTLGESHRQLLAGMLTPPAAFGLVIRDIAIDILVAIVFVMGVIAAFDFVWSRFHWRQELRMTRQEVKDEMKQSEGDPIVKGRLRSLARDRARRRMMTAVPRATLIIANPTHFSIALRYVREENSAPVVLAKGQVARSMYKQVSVDSVIPAQFYQAVAELVRIVYGNKRKAN
jgi:flagellar biosynthesis protein FlhB